MPSRATPGGVDVLSPLSRPDGSRLVFAGGNAGQNLGALILIEPGQTYYWSVQAVDGTFRGGPFSDEKSFTMNSVLAPPGGVLVPGDTNGDGAVDAMELDTVLSAYWATSPPDMESMLSPSNTTFTFALSNLSSLTFQVLATTNVEAPLVEWQNIGPATLHYEFSDPDATDFPQRFYHRVWP